MMNPVVSPTILPPSSLHVPLKNGPNSPSSIFSPRLSAAFYKTKATHFELLIDVIVIDEMLYALVHKPPWNSFIRIDCVEAKLR